MPKSIHSTKKGKYLLGDSVKLLAGPFGDRLAGKVQLLLTSPPFPLNKKKSYGNLEGGAFRDWFMALAPHFAKVLAPTGSIVVEMGNAWESQRPVQSLLTLESLLAFVKHPAAGLRLCQEFVCYNPSRLPSPAAWVTIRRMRFTDSYTHVWWMAKRDVPKADTSKVQRPYSDSMLKLLKTKKFNSGIRPSEHRISKKAFLKNNGGSIMQNFIEAEPLNSDQPARLPNAFKMANTASTDDFTTRCRKAGIVPHPARMQPGLARFFIEFLTEKNDLVLDPFGGSNTTGFAAESLGRRWISFDMNKNYAKQSKIRFASLKRSN